MIEKILSSLLSGDISLEQALTDIRGYSSSSCGNFRLDTDRRRRSHLSEVIFGEGKPREVLKAIVGELCSSGQPVLVTRLTREVACELRSEHCFLEYDEVSRCLYSAIDDNSLVGHVSIVGAGSCDAPVVGEAWHSCRFFGVKPVRILDIGVSGIHRLMDKIDELADSDAIIVAAGMEGALPSVMNGLVKPPVIGLPTSVGYGASLGGLTPMLAMLAGCSPGVTVVNVDNGVGAAAAAAKIVFAIYRRANG